MKSGRIGRFFLCYKRIGNTVLFYNTDVNSALIQIL
ncbi:hypothetical protein L1279_000210 [Planomicrobium sp. HSC-17F08]|nr:hypothetical protein [Planomicrobium sp. HSC-17F08]